MSSIKYAKYKGSISFSTVCPDCNIMEGFSFGGSSHPVLCGLLCRGKEVSVWLTIWGEG